LLTLTLRHSRRLRISLFGLPPSLKVDFSISDLLLPVRPTGLVLTFDLHGVFRSRLHWAETAARVGTDLSFDEVGRRGKMRWVKNQALPFVIAGTNSARPSVSPEELREVLDLAPGIPVISSPAEFRRRDVKRVLSALVDQIETANLP
jgi:hypothetical protein